MNYTIEGKKFSLQSDMMRLVQNSIKERLDGLISKEVESAGEITPQTWKITAHDVTKIIKESPEMNSLLYDVQSLVTSSVEQFISNVENEPITELSKNKTFLHRPLNEVWLQDHCGIGPMHYEQIAENTSQHKPLKIRKQALNAFIQFVPSEVVTNQYWSQIRRNLKENLCEENNEVFALTLKIHAKLLQAASQFCVREGFISLVEGLHLYYSNLYHNSLPNFKSGIDLTNVIHDHLSKISHLILETTKEMPKNWLRYGERRVEEIVGVFVDLLAVHTYSSKLNLPKDIIYPFHIISVLDPKANWCKQWVHGAFGQHIFLNILSQNMSLVSYLVNEVISYMEQHENEHLEILQENKISGHILKSAIFSHSLNILSKIVSYEKGRKLFPINLRTSEESVSIEGMLVRMITYLNLKNKYEVPQFETEFVTNFITNIFKTEFEEMNDKFITVLIEPLQLEHNLNHLNIPVHTINILCELTNNSMRIYGLLGGRHNHKLSFSKISRNQNSTNSSAASIRRNRSINLLLDRQYSARMIKIPSKSTADPSSPATIIEHFTTMIIRNKDVSQINTLLSLIEICGKLFIIHEGLSMLGVSNTHLIPSAVNVYMQLSSEIESFVNGASFGYSLKSTDYKIQSQTLYRSLGRFLSSVASTPCGLHALAQQDAVIQDLLTTMFQASHIPWENPEFRYMVSLMTSVPECVPVLSEESHRIFSKSLSNLQCVFEDPVALMTGSDRKQVQAIQYFTNIIFSFVPNLQGVVALLNEPEGSNDGTLVDADPIPTSLLELLTYDITVDWWHYISLLTLRALTTNIDVCLQLSTKFQFQERLLKLQAENVTSDDNTDIEDGEDSQTQSNTTNKPIIIDECSMLRHQILVTTYVVGGPTERIIPPTIIESEQLDDGEPNFFSSFPPPHFMSTRNMKNTRIKGQTDLQKFLQDTKQGLHDANWLSHVRRAYKSSRSEDIKAHVLLDLINQVAKLNFTSASFLNEAYPDVESSTLFPEDYLGIKLAIRYGVRCHLLQENSQSKDNLAQLLLISQKHVKKRRDTTFNGFDWFIATLFLLCGGNVDRCRSCIESVLSLPVAPFIWRTLASAHHHLPQHTFMFGHLLELLIKIELPLAFSALQLAGASWWLICRQWMAQCFWNVLDWSQICHWLVIGILNQPDYMLYFCVSLLRHIQPRVLHAVNNENAWEQIMITPIEGFQVGDQLSYMEKLAKRHRTSVLHHLISISTSAT